MTGISRMPESTRFSMLDHRRARETSRWRIEQEKWEEHCLGMEPEAISESAESQRIDGVNFSVQPDRDAFPDEKRMHFTMMIPQRYPNELPKIYPIDRIIKYDPHHNHTYRDKDKQVHICVMFENQWTRDGSIAGMMVLTALWWSKYLIWESFGEWPGLGQKHCTGCSRAITDCNCNG